MMVYGFFTAATIHALYAIFQFITRSYFTVAGNDPRYLAPEGFRSIGWLGSPDGTAILIVTVIPMMLGYFFNERNRPAKMIVGLALIICVTGILVTKVRIAGLSLMISMFVVFIIGLVRGWIGYGSTIRAAFAGLLVMAMLSPFIIQRFEKGSWGEARIPLMVTASNMIEKHWATGVGSSNYLFHIESNLPMKLRGSWEAIVHNEYMLRLAETGVIGFTLYYALLLAICWRLWRLTKRTGNQWISFVSAGLLAAIAGSLAHRMTSIYHLSAIYTQYCAFFGMAGFMWFLDEQN
jgi:O-antigen ligase